MDYRTVILSAAIVLGSPSRNALSAEAEPAAADAQPPTSSEPQDLASEGISEGSFASDEDRLDGDHLKLRVNVYGFEAIDGPEKGIQKCAPKESKVVVVAQVDDYVLVRISLSKAALAAKADDAINKAAAARSAATAARVEATKATEQANKAAAAVKSTSAASDVAAAASAAAGAANAAVVAADSAGKNAAAAEQALKSGQRPKAPKEPGMFATEEAASLSAISVCASTGMVNDYTAYKIETVRLMEHPNRRTGVMFGALVVPFKFHLGGENKLSASSTIAPYVGFRGPAPFGLTFTPVVSAGLGLVPVNNATTDETDTKSAFSVALGVLLTQSKNDKFNAGVLFGKDFLSKSDRAGDDTVDEVWFSIYAGYKL
jgi:hypothetical protein